MRILHIITTIEIGGAEKHLLQLASFQRKLGHEVKVIYLKGKPQLSVSFTKNKIEVLNREDSNLLRILLLFLRHLNTFSPSIVHAHLPRAELFVCIASFMKKFTYVISRHNSEPLFTRKSEFINRTLTKFVSKKSRGVIYISEAARIAFDLRNDIPAGESNTIIHYGIELKNVSQRNIQYSKNCKKKCLTFSRLTEQKNLERLIKAFSGIRNEDYSFDIYGEGELEDSLQNQIVRRGLQKQIQIHPKVYNVEKILEKYDFFILGSLYEGFGLALLEAMNAQKVIIASGKSSIIEILGKEYKYLFDPTSVDSIKETILEAWESADDMTLNYLQERVKLFTLEKMVSKTLVFYDLVTST